MHNVCTCAYTNAIGVCYNYIMVDYPRIREMQQLYSTGMRKRHIALIFDLTPERVRQLLTLYPPFTIPVRFYYRNETVRVRIIKPRPMLYGKLYYPNTEISMDGMDRSLAKHLDGRDYTRELIRIRDNHTCQDCGKQWDRTKRRLDVHHLGGLCGKLSTGYDKLSASNILITLCHKCHFNHPMHTFNRSKHHTYAQV